MCHLIAAIIISMDSDLILMEKYRHRHSNIYALTQKENPRKYDDDDDNNLWINNGKHNQHTQFFCSFKGNFVNDIGASGMSPNIHGSWFHIAHFAYLWKRKKKTSAAPTLDIHEIGSFLMDTICHQLWTNNNCYNYF